jgi:hypothetical protein
MQQVIRAYLIFMQNRRLPRRYVDALLTGISHPRRLFCSAEDTFHVRAEPRPDNSRRAHGAGSSRFHAFVFILPLSVIETESLPWSYIGSWQCEDHDLIGSWRTRLWMVEDI